MPASKARIKANNKYRAKAYEALHIMVKKGERDGLKEYAAARGESLNAFVLRAIRETMERDAAANAEKTE